MVAEHSLSASDLIYPVFILMGKNRREPVESMPGIERMSIDLLLYEADYLAKLGVPAIALFPVIPKEFKTACASEAFNPEEIGRAHV
jgi:porphobilinogen synthase